MSGLRYDIKPVDVLRAEIEAAASKWGLAPGTHFEEVNCDRVRCEWISADSDRPTLDAVYLHAHGGGYYRGSSRVDAAVCSFLCAASGARCLSVNYRRPPDEGVFPAALDDFTAVWRWLTSASGGGVPASRIVVGGTSAGGGLCLALLLRLLGAADEQPAAAIALSPWTDMTQSGASFVTNAEHGPDREYLEHWGKVYLDGANPTNPLASPLFGDMRGLPPILLQAGGNETMLDDSTAFAAAAARAGCNVSLEVYAGQPHSFQHEAATEDVGHEAVSRMAQFMRRWIDKGVGLPPESGGLPLLVRAKRDLNPSEREITMAIPVPEPRVARFERLGYGMFIHWGLYALMGQGEWVQHLRKIPMDEYARLKERFTADEFDGRAIARIARAAGMKYITLTSRHHDGFSLYDTRGLSDHDAPHSAAGRDLAAEFVDGCRAEGIVPFFYHTTLDWYQPSFDDDFDAYLDYLHQSVEVLCSNYGDIGGLWFDGNWSRPDADWKEDRLYGIIRKHQPEAMIINNTGLGAKGSVGHPEIDSVTFEQGRPTPMDREGMDKHVAAEMCQTMNRHWGIGSEDYNYLSPGAIIENLCACRKVGANYLLNVGPTASGRIPDYESAALRRAGEWIATHEQVVYEGRPVAVKGTGADFALTVDGRLYLFVHGLSVGGDAHVTTGGGGAGPRGFTGVDGAVAAARWIDNGEELLFSHDADSGLFCIDATGYPYGVDRVVRVAEVSLA